MSQKKYPSIFLCQMEAIVESRFFEPSRGNENWFDKRFVDLAIFSIFKLVYHTRIYTVSRHHCLFRVGLAGMGLSASHNQNSQLNHRRKTTKLRNSTRHPSRGRRTIASAN